MTARLALPTEDPKTLELRRLYRLHRDFVWRTLLALGVAEFGVEEALQDVFLTLHRRWEDYDPNREVRAWLYGIARRVAANHRRQHARNRCAPLIEPIAQGADLDEELARQEAALLVERFLETLDEDQRDAFVAIDIEGLTAPQVAEALEVSTNTIYSRLRLARRRFEAALARHRTRQDRETQHAR